MNKSDKLFKDFKYVNPEDMAKIERENNRMRWLFRQILLDLPKNRDWLNPDYEREMREWTKNPD